MNNPFRKLIDQLNAFFNHPGLRRQWIKVRIVVGILLLICLIPCIQPDWFWIGFTVSMLGELVQLWCFASLKKQKELACNGPYVLVRNPMYLGRYFIVLGLVLLLGTPGLYAVIPYTVLYGFYMTNRVKREERTLKGKLGEDYANYCATVNRFLPSLRGLHLGKIGYWRGSLLFENHGPMNLLGLLGAYGVLYVTTFLVFK